MHYRVYVDVIFLVNFVMDYMILTVTSWILSIHTTYLKRILAAGLGAVWVCIALMLRLVGIGWKLFTYLFMSIVMVLTMGDITNIREVIKRVNIFYIVVFMFGGLLNVLYYYMGDFWLIIGGIGIGTPLITVGLKFVTDKIAVSQVKMTAVIVGNAGKLKTEALCDTGNSLWDPYYNEPVSVIEAGKVKCVTGPYSECSYHLIPYSSIGTEAGIIPVVRLKKIILNDGHKIKCVENPLVALYSGHIGSKTGYKLIIHPKLMENAKQERG